jgi:thiol-disulfide isomerase/thioredoxin
MTSTQKPRPRPSPRPARPAAGSRRPAIVVGIIAALVVVALVVAIAAGSGGGSTDDGGSATGADVPTETGATPVTVSVEGTPLPALPDAGADPAVGQPMPVLSGTGLDGSPVQLPTTGRPTMILFVAHWCPHCQAEVPVVQDWVDAGGLPAGVDLVTVSTAADPRRPNFPPAEWLASEGWTAPVLADDADGDAAQAAGLTAFPFFVAVDADGTVAARASGELTPAQLDQFAAEVAGSAS